MAADSLTIETFTEYALGMCFLLLRLYARIKYVGFRSLGLSDVLAILAMVCIMARVTYCIFRVANADLPRFFGPCKPSSFISSVCEQRPLRPPKERSLTRDRYLRK